MQKSIYTEQHSHLRQFLIELRKKAGFSQRELARRIGRERSFVARVELGERRLDSIELWWYCRCCDASPVTIAAQLMRAFDRIVENPA